MSKSPLITPSKPNAIGNSPLETCRDFGQYGVFPSSSITAADKTKAFDLNSVSFACVTLSPKAGDTPRACELTVTGYDASGKQVKQVKHAYDPGRVAPAAMKFVEFKGFSKLRRVTFSVTSELKLFTVLILDDVVHCDYY